MQRILYVSIVHMRRKEIESGRTNQQKSFYAPTFDANLYIMPIFSKNIEARQPPPSQLHGSEVYVINIL